MTEAVDVVTNDHMVLVVGEPATGKSVSLRNLSSIIIFNCEAGKKLPYKASKDKQVKVVNITNPKDLPALFDAYSNIPQVKYIAIDGLNFLMDMFESQFVLTSANTQKAWSDYAQFFKRFMQEHVARSKKTVIFTAHTKVYTDALTGVSRVMVPVKGALANQGVEAYFTTIVATKKERLVDLEDYANDMLHVTEDDEIVNYKHVFQTRPTANTTNERVRSPMGMFSIKETFMDNDLAQLCERMHEYYAEE